MSRTARILLVAASIAALLGLAGPAEARHDTGWDCPGCVVKR